MQRGAGGGEPPCSDRRAGGWSGTKLERAQANGPIENFLFVSQKLNIVFQLILIIRVLQQITQYQLERFAYQVELNLLLLFVVKS